MRKAALSIAATAVLLMGTLALQAENYWQRAVVNYSRQQYRSGNQNWQVSQSWQGWMYFANNKGLLEFDGSNWQTYALPGNPKVRAVRAEGDTIYVGALGQFGRFVRNQKGRLVYERLSDHLEKAGQLNVWHIHRIGDFKHRQHPAVIRWDDNAIRLEYCASNYDIAKSIQYSYRLEGPAEEDWSPYSHRRVTRLIGQIDTNIEHDDDLEAFKDSFDIIHNHFLQTLSERYPSLTHKEKMLCTYIRMNLLSKEIAPLLNISTRGVEISRYRIRQKLNLDTKESLSDFLQRI